MCTHNKAQENLIALIKSAKTVVVMDGFLQQSSIDIVKKIRSGDSRVIQNMYQPYAAVPCIINVTDK